MKVDNSGMFTMNSGTITGNSSDPFRGGGSGVYVNGGKFAMSGGDIGSNSSDGGYGGGVNIDNNGEFTMTGGTIISNQSGDRASYEGYGGGVYVYGTFIKSGESIISLNRSESNGTQVYYDDDISPKYRNGDLEKNVNISTNDLETNWDT